MGYHMIGGMVRLNHHLSLCSRGVSTRNAPLPVITVQKYLKGGAMRTRRHYTQLAQAIAQSLCGCAKGGPLWRAVRNTQHRDWTDVVMLVDDVTVIDWGNIILIDYGDRDGWGPALTTLVLRELNLIANRGMR